jgi:hypothetical protein
VYAGERGSKDLHKDKGARGRTPSVMSPMPVSGPVPDCRSQFSDAMAVMVVLTARTHPGPGRPSLHARPRFARPAPSVAMTGLTPATSAPRLGTGLTPCHICTATRDGAHSLPHLHRDWARPGQLRPSPRMLVPLRIGGQPRETRRLPRKPFPSLEYPGTHPRRTPL